MMADSFSNAEIIERCNQAAPGLCLGSPLSDNKVLRITDELAVKFGFLLSKVEADNQTKSI